MTEPSPRAALAGVPAYVPGKPPAARDGLPTYKLSSNENPYPPLPGVLEEAVRVAGSMNRYPDMGCVALYEALAAKLEVGTEKLAAGTGSVALLYHLVQAFCEPGDEVVYAWRSFEAYPIAVAVNGAESVQVPVTATGEHDLDAMADAITDRTKVVVVCSPNNPTGPAVTASAMSAFLTKVPTDVVIVIDEAYREFVRLEDRVDAHRADPHQPERRRDAHVRQGLRPGRPAHRLPGRVRDHRRCGPRLRAALRRLRRSPRPPRSRRSHARTSSLERVEALVAERARVTAALAEQGWTIPDAQGNFVWLPLGDRTAEFAAASEEAGIMVRPFAGDGVRISIGETAGNDVFLKWRRPRSSSSRARSALAVVCRAPPWQPANWPPLRASASDTSPCRYSLAIASASDRPFCSRTDSRSLAHQSSAGECGERHVRAPRRPRARAVPGRERPCRQTDP